MIQLRSNHSLSYTEVIKIYLKIETKNMTSSSIGTLLKGYFCGIFKLFLMKNLKNYLLHVNEGKILCKTEKKKILR